MVRGRPKSPLLNQADIVTEALRIADSGREPTLGSISSSLGVHVSSLYNHIESKAHLVNLMRERVGNMHPLPPLPHDDWVASIKLVAHQLRAVLLTYPVLLASFASAPLDPAGEYPYLDDFLSVLQSAGFDQPDAAHIFDFLGFITLGSALDLTYEVPDSENEATFEFGLDRFISGLESLRNR
ncbi:TetR/AcrR family transcriptional regulator C-terminal domain-containing protein [Leifsonia sp. YAF41]|uniref:TetR/AcrR family transcriptional regulator C-terminal domain-containing protein n=1 Tax=Leifsonia sp. YAF41 TaxID=3233086 RepID=UPI003F9AB15C